MSRIKEEIKFLAPSVFIFRFFIHDVYIPDHPRNVGVLECLRAGLTGFERRREGVEPAVASVFAVTKEWIMNQHKLGLNLRTASAWGDNGRKPLRVHRDGVSRIRVWLAEGLCAARERPVVWLATILLSADLATALELCTPLQTLATLLVPVLAGATMLMYEYRGIANRSTARETLDSVVRPRGALFALALWSAAILCIGNLLSRAIGLADPAWWTSAFTLVVNDLALAMAIAAVWFAPALIVLNRCSSLEAMMTSLRAVLRNWPVTLCYALLIAADVLAAPLTPMIVRGLVVTPLISALIVLSMYGSHRDIIYREPDYG
jgi:hypothetical protein